MGEMCRSAEMDYIQVLVPEESIYDFADQMARKNIMMFTDLNEDVQMFQRDHIKDITRINEAERALRGIQNFYEEYGVIEEEDMELDEYDIETERMEKLDLFNLVDDIQKFYRDLAQQVISSRNLKWQLETSQDKLDVLKSLDTFLTDQPRMLENGSYDGMGVPLVGNTDGTDNVRFLYLAGVCPVSKLQSLRKQIFHITRGNRYFRSEPIGDGGRKAAFVVFFLGEYARNMIKKFCEWMDVVEIFIDSKEGIDRANLINEIQAKLQNEHQVLVYTNQTLTAMMEERLHAIKTWSIQLKQEMAIRVLLNKFKAGFDEKSNWAGFIRAEGWIPSKKIGEVEEALKQSEVSSNSGVVEEKRGRGVTPTYFETNKFTEAFQCLIDTYGVPRNGEFNPTVPSIVTFPFLFGMMYGDVFHGSFLFLAGLYLVWNEEANAKSKGELTQGLHFGRYLILLMGMFAVYNGLIYNDCTSMSFNGFNGQQWETVWPKGPKADYDKPVIHGKATGVYYFGVDPVWAISDQQLSFTNSLKMKLSVIVGITQMTFGLFIKLSNHIHERDWLSIYGEFIPQLIFMISFFNYMQFIIVYKWCRSWIGKYNVSLITVLVDMVLKPGQMIEDENILFHDQDQQASLQVVFILCMFLSIPWMLLMKPLILKRRMDAAAAGRALHDEEASLAHEESHGGHGGHGHEETFGAIMIEQIIHTIEYVLGTVSNTASYLRLWALSLAHAQLAEVFYSKTILSGMQAGSGVMTFIMCGAFFATTIAVLLCMDVLECFLHALRLHWVEFQNKFYYADGVAFVPFSYKSFCLDN